MARAPSPPRMTRTSGQRPAQGCDDRAGGRCVSRSRDTDHGHRSHRRPRGANPFGGGDVGADVVDRHARTPSGRREGQSAASSWRAPGGSPTRTGRAHRPVRAGGVVCGADPAGDGGARRVLRRHGDRRRPARRRPAREAPGTGIGRSSARRTRERPSRPERPAGPPRPWPPRPDEARRVARRPRAPRRSVAAGQRHRGQIGIRDVPQRCRRGARCPALLDQARAWLARDRWRPRRRADSQPRVRRGSTMP